MAKRILVVDDEELLIRSLTRLLEKHGYEVYTTRNGTDAQVMVGEEDFDLVICDIRMPGVNGVETVRSIQKIVRSQNKADLPVIFITGFADETIEEEAKKMKPLAYLYKPFEVQEILQLIRAKV